jgi:hypothetical protein
MRGEWEELGLRIREVWLLQFLRISEKKEESRELECWPRCWTPQYQDSGNTEHRS